MSALGYNAEYPAPTLGYNAEHPAPTLGYNAEYPAPTLGYNAEHPAPTAITMQCNYCQNKIARRFTAQTDRLLYVASSAYAMRCKANGCGNHAIW